MSIGLPLLKSNLDADFGNAALALRNAFRRVEQLRHFCLITPDATFTALGYTEAEVGIIKSAFADSDNVRQAWEGTIALPQQDYRVNIDQLGGDLLT